MNKIEILKEDILRLILSKNDVEDNILEEAILALKAEIGFDETENFVKGCITGIMLESFKNYIKERLGQMRIQNLN